MKMFTVTIKVACQNTGRRYLLTSVVATDHELDARGLAMEGLSDNDLLMDANILTVDIVENLDRFALISVNEVAK
jgi:hypothetical protein